MVKPVLRKRLVDWAGDAGGLTLHEYIDDAGELLQWRDELFDAYRLKTREELEGRDRERNFSVS